VRGDFAVQRGFVVVGGEPKPNPSHFQNRNIHPLVQIGRIDRKTLGIQGCHEVNARSETIDIESCITQPSHLFHSVRGKLMCGNFAVRRGFEDLGDFGEETLNSHTLGIQLRVG
jgi:hypothetical protein